MTKAVVGNVGAVTRTPPSISQFDSTRLPNPTTGRIIVLLAALLSIGFAVGGQVHTTVLGEQWIQALEACFEGFPSGFSVVGEDGVGFAQCRSAAERERAAYLAAGAAFITLGALAVLYVAPVVVRRRRDLREPSDGLSPAVDRVTALAAAAGLRSVPKLLIGWGRERDPFCFGMPGRTVLVLPRAVAIHFKDAALFDPLVRHELTHVRHRDVGLAWLARGFLMMASVAAVTPVFIGLVIADLSTIADYLWRAALLVGVGWLVSRAVLRAREHDADLAGSAAGGRESLVALLAGDNALPANTGWRRWTDHHPSPARRVEVLHDPSRIAGVGFISGFLPAVLALAAAPAFVTVATALLTGIQTTAFLVPGVVVAAIVLGASVGADVWRAAKVDAIRDGGRRALHDPAVSVGVGLGVVVGQVVSPDSAWLGPTAGVPPWLLLYSGLLAAGATVGVCGLARCASHRHAPAVVVLLAAALPWSLALWIGQSLQVVGELGLSALRLQLVFGLASWPAAAVVLLIAGAAAWSRSRKAWADVAIGFAAGAAAGGIFLWSTLLSGPLESDSQKVELALFGIDQAALAAVAVAAVVPLLVGIRGVAAAALAMPLATATAIGVFVGFVGGSAGSTDFPLVQSVFLPALLIGAVGWLSLAMAGLFVGASRGVVPAWLVGLIAAASSVILVAVSAGLGPLIAPGVAVHPAASVDPASGSVPSLGSTAAASSAADYSEQLAPPLAAQMEGMFRLVNVLADPPADPAAASLLEVDVEPLLVELERQVNQIQPVETAVKSVHADLVTTLVSFRSYLDGLIQFHRVGDARILAGAVEHRQQAADTYQAWADGVAALK